MSRIPDWLYVETALAWTTGLSIAAAGELLDIHEETIRRWRHGDWTRLGEKTRVAVHKAMQKHGRLPEWPRSQKHDPAASRVVEHRSHVWFESLEETLASMRDEAREEHELHEIWLRISTLAFHYRAIDEVMLTLHEMSYRDSWSEEGVRTLRQIEDLLRSYKVRFYIDANVPTSGTDAPPTSPGGALPPSPGKKRGKRVGPSAVESSPARKRSNGE